MTHLIIYSLPPLEPVDLNNFATNSAEQSPPLIVVSFFLHLQFLEVVIRVGKLGPDFWCSMWSIHPSLANSDWN